MKLIVGISGATGAIYGVRLLEALRKVPGIETHLILSDPAKRTITFETNYTVAQVEALATQNYDLKDIGAAVASGSFRTEGMVIAPCSIKTLSALANSYNDNLLVRAGDVCLKEGRKLVVVVRETPLHQGHLRLALTLSQMGAIILPPIPAFYHKPKSIDDIVNHTIGKILDQFGIDNQLFKHWQGMEED